jgi:hypothetical protein
VILSGLFWIDSGRHALLGIALYFFQPKEAVIRIEGLNRKVTEIKKIHVHLSNGLELIFSNVIINRENFFDKPSIHIGTFITKGPVANIGTEEKSMEILPLVMKLKFFLNELSIENGIFQMVNDTYLLESFNFNWKTMKYWLVAQNEVIKIQAKGFCENLASCIKIDTAKVEYKNTIYECCGNLDPSTKTIVIKTKINVEDLPNFNAVPSAVSKNFRDVSGHMDITCYFADEFKCSVAAIFKKFQTTLGTINCVHENGQTQIIGNIGWVNIFGFDFTSLKCGIDGEKNAQIHLHGKDFEIIALMKFNDRIWVKKLELNSPKGFLKSTKPFFLADNSDYNFAFNFKQLDFWNKIASVSGAGFGNFSYKNKAFFGQGSFERLTYKNHEFYSLSYLRDNDSILIAAKNANVSGMRMANVELKVKGEHFDASGKINEDGILKASGEVTKSFKKLSLRDGKISFPHSEIRLETCTLDVAENNHKVDCIILNKKKRGKAQINFNRQDMLCNFKSFPLEQLLELFNHRFPVCKLDGNLKLKSENKNFIGEGKLLLSNLIAYKRNLEIYIKISQAGTKIDTNLKNKKDFLNISAFLPINFGTDGSILKNLYSNLLDCRISVSAQLEKLLELPDYSDIRGDLNGNFNITGSFANPVVTGKAQWQKAFIAFGDILLKNGSIVLTAEGKNTIGASAKFTDYKKKIAMAFGSGKLFFDGIIPNIDVNLLLKFDNFALFDSDDLKIDVVGEGSMSGPIDDITIRGNATIPKCKIQDFATKESPLGLSIENDIYLNENIGNNGKKDFLKYDISLHCSNIEFIGNIFNMHLRGDLTLSSYLDNATLIGELKLFDGKLDLFGKRMKFTNGKVTFFKEFPFDPVAFFNCQRNFGDISVGFDIKNTPKKGISLNLYSSPSYTQDVILSKMLFGKESKYLTIGEAAQLAHVVASLNQSGYIFSVLNTFQNIGIDSISFAGADNQSFPLYSNSQNTSTQSNINASAGKYVRDNIFISVNKKNDGASFDIDFSVTPQISIKANSKGEAGLSWKYRY